MSSSEACSDWSVDVFSDEVFSLPLGAVTSLTSPCFLCREGRTRTGWNSDHFRPVPTRPPVPLGLRQQEVQTRPALDARPPSFSQLARTVTRERWISFMWLTLGCSVTQSCSGSHQNTCQKVVFCRQWEWRPSSCVCLVWLCSLEHLTYGFVLFFIWKTMMLTNTHFGGGL